MQPLSLRYKGCHVPKAHQSACAQIKASRSVGFKHVTCRPRARDNSNTHEASPPATGMLAIPAGCRSHRDAVAAAPSIPNVAPPVAANVADGMHGVSLVSQTTKKPVPAKTMPLRRLQQRRSCGCWNQQDDLLEPVSHGWNRPCRLQQNRGQGCWNQRHDVLQPALLFARTSGQIC